MRRKCRDCKKTKDVSKFYKNKTCKGGYTPDCRECKNAYERIRHQTWYRDKHLQIQRNYHRRIKRELIAAYGRKCKCCGETRFEFLQIDHINGGGIRHRRTLTIHMAAHLKKLGYPKKGFRLLCANCNSSFGLYGYCPHQNATNKH